MKTKKHETVSDVIRYLDKLTKGHERYPHDTVKIDGYPISYQQVKDLTKRLRAAKNRERKQVEMMVSEIYWKNKNVLKWWPTLFKRDLTGKGKEDAINLKWCMIYASELQHLIHYYGYLRKYAQRDERAPWDTATSTKGIWSAGESGVSE